MALALAAITDAIAAEIDFYLLERQRQCQCGNCAVQPYATHSPETKRENYFYKRIYVISFQVIQCSD